MFISPIKPNVETFSMEDIFRFSCSVETKEVYSPYLFTCHGDYMTFTDVFGHLFVTPYRSKLISVLSALNYKDSSELPYPFKDKEIPEEYLWLKHIIDEENWSETYQRAFKISVEKGISAVDIPTSGLTIKEIKYDKDYFIQPLCSLWLNEKSKDNIGTYIYLNPKEIVVCDEYGRTFYIKGNIILNNIINTLISAGYKHTESPEKYVSHFFGSPTLSNPK